MVLPIMVRRATYHKEGCSHGTRRQYATPMARSSSSVGIVGEAGTRVLAVVITLTLVEGRPQGWNGQ